jgi:hypothetical protein
MVSSKFYDKQQIVFSSEFKLLFPVDVLDPQKTIFEIRSCDKYDILPWKNLIGKKSFLVSREKKFSLYKNERNRQLNII